MNMGENGSMDNGILALGARGWSILGTSSLVETVYELIVQV